MKRTESSQDLHSLAANVIRLSQLLTRGRENLPAAYLKDKGLREAYEAYYLPPNREKIRAVLRTLTFSPDRPVLRVLDLGCGPGTATLGVLSFFTAQENRPRLEFTAVDRVSENLAATKEFFSSFLNSQSLDASLKTLCSTIEQAPLAQDSAFDLIILSNSLNELFSNDEDRISKRTALVSDLLKRHLADDGQCIILEPALRETSRDLLSVRDGLLGAGYCIASPCLCTSACPALVNPKDWCHEDVAWDPPETIRELDKLTGLRKDSLKFSFLVIGKENRTIAAHYGEQAFRVVSEPLVSKGKREFYVCGRRGRRLITRLDKDETPGNSVFGNLDRGDVVVFENLADEEKRFKVGKETGVKRISRFSVKTPERQSIP